MTKELIEKLLNNQPQGQDIPTYLAQEFKRIQEVKRIIRNAQEDKIKLKEEFDQDIRTINEAVKIAQSLCKHEEKSFNPDPAGGRDSYYECDICGKTL
jgi:LPS O-antigen subunit length determinant protein (WzzB/FepE family)